MEGKTPQPVSSRMAETQLPHTTRRTDAAIGSHAAAFLDDLAERLRGGLVETDLPSQLVRDFARRMSLPLSALVRQEVGGWNIIAQSDAQGLAKPLAASLLPTDLIADAIDSGQPRTDGEMHVFPASSQTDPPSTACLVVKRDRGSDTGFDVAAMMLVSAYVHSELDRRNETRLRQLASVLEAAAVWQRSQLEESSDENTLLRQIADTATELADCQRASIFLWDKRRKKLIGKPALGIDDAPLEVPDNAGVVGEVLATKEPQIWNGGSDDESRVNRNIDRSLDFDTRSLVAVPLIGSRGETIGVFEAINHHQNSFDSSHVALLADLATHAAVAIEAQRRQRSLTESRDRLVDDAAERSPLIGEHSEIVAIRQSGTRVAPTDLTVLILGKNGTGKEIVARHVHYASDRRSGPFIAVNCAALVESLLESELFGHEKGSFTDANATRAGKFEMASGGTLFLDEVGDMSLGGQAKLLRVLEQREVVRVGGSLPIPVDVRVIAATNQPLEQLIAEKRFREDLFFRLNVVSLNLPDLAKRGQDVLLLADHFLEHFCNEIGRQKPRFSSAAQTALLSHPWPGNVRELRNTIERACYLSSGEEIAAADLELRSGNTNSQDAAHAQAVQLNSATVGSLSDSTKQFQVLHIRNAISACGGNMTEAAAKLDLHRSNLYRKMKQLGMQVSEEKT
ncbi:MAG: sigma-54-dependent Fis family transcriptional regulator [Planctomycetota bacterium]